MSEIDLTKRVFRTTFRRTDGRRESHFFNAADLNNANSLALTIAAGQKIEDVHEIDPKTGYRIDESAL